MVKAKVAHHSKSHATVQPSLRCRSVGKLTSTQLEQCLCSRDRARLLYFASEKEARSRDEHSPEFAALKSRRMGAKNSDK